MPKSLIAGTETIDLLLTGTKYLSLHTANPTESGNQTTNEATYDNYVRMPVVFVRVNNTASLSSPIRFPAAGSSQSITYIGIGDDLTGAGDLIYYAQITPAMSVSDGLVPRVRRLDIEEI